MTKLVTVANTLAPLSERKAKRHSHGQARMRSLDEIPTATREIPSLKDAVHTTCCLRATEITHAGGFVPDRTRVLPALKADQKELWQTMEARLAKFEVDNRKQLWSRDAHSGQNNPRRATRGASARRR